MPIGLNALTTSEPPTVPARRWLRAAGLALAVLTVAGVVLIWRYRGGTFDWSRFWSTVTAVDPVWLGASIALMLLTYFGRALRWQAMLRPIRPSPDLWGLTSATVIGFTAVVVLGRASELVRPYLISVKERVPFSSQVAAWVLERILDALAVLLIFGYALTQPPPHGAHLGAAMQWVLRAGGYAAAMIGAACLLFLWVFRNFSEAAQSRILAALTFLPEATYKRIQLTMAAFVQGVQSTRHHSVLAQLLFYTVLEWLVIVAAYYTLFRAFGATSGFAVVDVLVFIGFVSFGSIVQLPGIGGGIQVVTVIVLTELFGLSFESATGMAILIWALGFLVIVPFGVAFALREGINWRKFRRLPEELPA